MGTEISGAEILVYIIYAVVGILLFSFMMYQIIYNAAYGRKIWVESQKQTQILTEMARKAGVEESKLTEILSDSRYKP